MARTLTVCTVPGCPRLTQTGQCPDHRAQADRDRGTPAQRGYTSRGHRGFRAAVLDRDPLCVVCGLAPATVADHWPGSRRDLRAAGRDPDDPAAGRGLCAPCHSRATAAGQPGGWNMR